MLDDFVFFVKGDAPWKTAADFVKDAKAKPPKTFAFATGGTTDVMADHRALQGDRHRIEHGQLQQRRRGADGASRRPRAMRSIGNPLEFMGHLKSGSGARHRRVPRHRFAELPDVSTMKEQGIEAPNFQMWRGVAMPEGRARAGRRSYWEGVMQKVVASPQFKAYLRDNVASEAPIAGPGLREIPGRSGAPLPRSPRQVGASCDAGASAQRRCRARAPLRRPRRSSGSSASFGHPFWEGFAPQSGFLPFFYGVLLAGLSDGDPGGRLSRDGRGEPHEEPVGKPLVILVALTAAVIGIERGRLRRRRVPAAPVPVRGRRTAAGRCVRSSSPARRRRP